MKQIIVVLFFLAASGTSVAAISSIDFVEIKNGNREEAIFYYQNNWLKYRAAALSAGVIESYDLLITVDADAEIDIVLITVYADPDQYAKREENFAEIISGIRSDGVKLLNHIEPGDFREVIFSSNYRPVH